jgi:DNA-directed RNA polymerase specialized sigma24 family protein
MSMTNTSEGSHTGLDSKAALFDRRFWRCYGLQYFIACRILDDPDQATKAVENCWHSASARAPHFEYEGAFRSWLLRVLIGEALLLLGQRQQTFETNIALHAAGSPSNSASVVGADAQRRG